DERWREPVAAMVRGEARPSLFYNDEADRGRALACPLGSLGALYCDRIPSGGSFGPVDVERAATFAAAATAILAARALGGRLGRAVRRRDALLAASTEGLVVVDAAGAVEAWNPPAAALLGPAIAAPRPSIASWPVLAALAGPGGEDVDGAVALLPGG